MNIEQAREIDHPDLTEFDAGELRFMVATALKEIDKLREALATLKQQEPVAHFNTAVNETVGAIAYEYAKHKLPSGTPLYLAAGAQAVQQGWKLLKDSTIDERSWPDDYKHENGNYQNLCCECGRVFNGYKRRVMCKVCSATPVQAGAQEQRVKSFAETHPANPDAKCKCEHWQSCVECHPTAHPKTFTDTLLERQALQLALEALENSFDLVDGEYTEAVSLYGNYPTLKWKIEALKGFVDDHQAAIVAVKEALAQERKPLTRSEKNRIWSSCSDAKTLSARASLFGTKVEAAHGIGEKS